MTKRPWLDHYPSDVPHDLPKVAYKNLPEFIRAAAETNGKTKAFTQVMPNGMNGSLSYARVDLLSDRFAVYLRDVIGLSAGDRVAVQMPNCLSYPIVAFGILKAGLVLVNTNPLYTATEMVHQFSDSGAKALVVIDMFADRLPDVLPKTSIEHVVTVKISEYFPAPVAGVIRVTQKYWSRTLPKIAVKHTRFSDALVSGAKLLSDDKLKGYVASLDESSIAALQYTGGTTGVSKGAMLSHGNLVTNTLQLITMCGNYMRQGKEVVVTALPLYHIFAFTINLLGFWHMGARNLLVPTPRPPSNLRRVFENYKVTWMTGVNTLFNALLNERWFVDSPPKHLRASAAGGMALHESVSERWRKVTGTPIVEGYGLTETSPVLTFNPLSGLGKDGTIGIPVPSTDVKCVKDDGSEAAVGEPGEIYASGPQIMLGYWQRPDETKATMSGAWFKTGDIATRDSDGYFTIVDRKKDMILVSGFNVYPNEVEEQIASFNGVLEVGVIGVPDEGKGEKVKAFIVCGSEQPTEAEIIAHCRLQLAAYKVPSSVEFVTELPKSPIGKILRRELRNQEIATISKKKG
jgi:long-chain acyl-CoA synthetase